MIFSLVSINSQPIFNVIDVNYETHMMILLFIENTEGLLVIMYIFDFLLPTER